MKRIALVFACVLGLCVAPAFAGHGPCNVNAFRSHGHCNHVVNFPAFVAPSYPVYLPPPQVTYVQPAPSVTYSPVPPTTIPAPVAPAPAVVSPTYTTQPAFVTYYQPAPIVTFAPKFHGPFHGDCGPVRFPGHGHCR